MTSWSTLIPLKLMYQFYCHSRLSKKWVQSLQRLGKIYLPVQFRDLSENNCFDLFKKRLMMEMGVTISRVLLPQEQFLQAI